MNLFDVNCHFLRYSDISLVYTCQFTFWIFECGYDTVLCYILMVGYVYIVINYVPYKTNVDDTIHIAYT